MAPKADFGVEWELLETARPVESENGVVVSGHPLASRAGVEILERGGNAIDAAVAVGFALAVVLPTAGNIGGGGYLVYRSAVGEVRALDYRETAPSAATPDMYIGPDGEPTRDSLVGHLAVGVPGSVAGLAAMHEELGSLPWADLAGPAIELAREHRIDAVRHLSTAAGKQLLSRFDTSSALFLVDGEARSEGSAWSQPLLAATLERIARIGGTEFYGGETAELLVAEMERGGGLITRQDLLDYRAIWREPVVFEYRGWRLYSMPPSSSGGVTQAILFGALEGFDPLPPFGSHELVQLETEVMRWAFVDRNQYLGDPDFVEMPLERLLSPKHAREIRERIVRGVAGSTPPFTGVTQESAQTTHYSVVDGEGNAASITTTLNGAFGSGVTVRGAGFLLNNEMDDFAAKPGHPNLYGLVQGEANAVAPGKRMLSSMSPTIVESEDGELLLVVGTPGGSTIITSVFQVISNVLDHGMSLAEAVAAPRVHHQALPDILFYEEAGLSARTVRALEEMGYELQERAGYSGDINAIQAIDGGWVGVADPRRGSGAMAAASTSGTRGRDHGRH